MTDRTAAEARLANERTTDAVLATVDGAEAQAQAEAEQSIALVPVPQEPTVLPASTVNLRSTSLVVLAALASLYVLHWAAAVVVPLLLGLMFSYALTPAVNRMVRWHIPRLAASSLLVVGILAGFGTMAYRLADDASAMIEGIPEVAQKLRTHPVTASARLIALTGWGTGEDLRKSIAAGFDAHLTKPVEPERVEDVLTEFLPAMPGI